MKPASDNVAEKVRLLIIDDNRASCLVQIHTIEENFENVEVASSMRPPPMEEMLGYDGIILDERLIGESGVDVARRIHRENWRIPLMIMTTLHTTDRVFADAYEVVDYVATKSDPPMFVNILRAFLRQIRRLRVAGATGTEH